jgi:hypothetical protein
MIKMMLVPSDGLDWGYIILVGLSQGYFQSGARRPADAGKPQKVNSHASDQCFSPCNSYECLFGCDGFASGFTGCASQPQDRYRYDGFASGFTGCASQPQDRYRYDGFAGGFTCCASYPQERYRRCGAQRGAHPTAHHDI